MDEEKKDVYSSIRCKNETKTKLREVKIHKRETDEDVILRLIDVYIRYRKAMV